MSVMLIANNCTHESGSFMGDQLCLLKTCYLFVENSPGVDRVIMSVSPSNEMHFLWEKFIEKYKIELVHDNWNPGDWTARWQAWDRWRTERQITMDDGTIQTFDVFKECYLRIHGALRQTLICGSERGLGRRNIYEYWLAGQEDMSNSWTGADWFDDSLIDHPSLTKELDVYVSPHAKTQGNQTFTFDFWADVVRELVEDGLEVTVGYNNPFCEDLTRYSNYHKHWGTHREWMDTICRHKVVACGNTGTGWLAAACGIPMVTMEPHHSVMADHRYRECGLKNIVEVVDGYKLDELGNHMGRVASYVAGRLREIARKRLVMTTGCYDVLHAGHVRHLQAAKNMGTRLVVALNSDSSVRALKGAERPVNPESQRKAVLEALRCVDEVRVFDGPDARPLIEELRPDVLVCGYGYTVDEIIGRDILEGYGGRCAVTYQKDASGEEQPSTTKIMKRVRVADIHAAICAAAPYTVNSPDKLKLIAEEFLSCVGLPGDVADLGTCRGGTALLLRKLAPEKHLHCFDTWAGNPYDDPLCHHKRGEWVASLTDCMSLVGRDDRTYYYQGVFPESAFGDPVENVIRPMVRNQQLCFVYVDMDTYQSTRDAIEFFWPRIVPGGVMVFDDYGWEPCMGVKKAVDEQFYGYSGKRVIEGLYTCIVRRG